MFGMIRRFISVLAILLGAATAAFGARSFWLAPVGGYSTYRMQDVNRDIGHFNADFDLQMDKVSGGAAFGFEAGVSIAPRCGVSAGFERMYGSSELEYAGGSRGFQLSANAYCVSAHYTLPASDVLNIGVAAGIGVISAAGQVRVSTVSTGTIAGDLAGRGVLLQGQLRGEYYLAPQVALVPSVGYRRAKIDRFEINGSPLHNPDGSRESLDYSGVILRLALKLVLR
jgi:hypothetical protein